MLFLAPMAEPETTQTSGRPTAIARVLQVVSGDVFVRFGRMFRHLALALGAEGVHVSLLTDDPLMVSELDGTPVECHLLRRLSGWWNWQLTHELEERLEHRPEVIHLWGADGLAGLGTWALRNHIPVVVHALSTGDVSDLLRRGPHQSFRWLAACQGLVDAARAQAPTLADRLQVVAPGFLTPEYLPEAQPATPDRTLGLLWAGRIDLASGLTTLVDAVGQVSRQGGDLQAVLVGHGPGVPELRAHICRARIQNRISLVDDSRLWDQVMHGADVYVVSARQQELSLAPLLAMAMGKTVIAARDQVADWFIEDQTAWQFTPGSAVELAYHLARAAARDRSVLDLSRSAASYAAEHCSIRRVVDDLLREYQCAAGAARACPR